MSQPRPKHDSTLPGKPPPGATALERPAKAPRPSQPLAEIIEAMNKSTLNQRDLFGRSLLSLAATAGMTRTVEHLLDHHYIDVLSTDYESGWTPLHRALAAGNIESAQRIMAHSRDAIRAKDRSKETPFEVMNALFLEDEGCLPPQRPHASSRLFMFGSNANHVLGFADPDDRMNPEMVKLRRQFASSHVPPQHKFAPFHIRQVSMSKLHTVVITKDPKHNIYICGISRGGRLGLGSESLATQFTFVQIPEFANSKVVAVATGLDHTVVLTDTRECYTFGSNRAGQLGYTVGKSRLESSSLPRKVGGDLKKKRLIGCSASNIHTVVYTEDEAYCWGKNVGHMGFSSDLATGGIVSEDISPMSTPAIIEPLPRKMPLDFAGKIETICATDVATIVLPERRQEVFVFMNSVFFRVPIPLADHSMADTKDFNAYVCKRVVPRTITISKIAASKAGSVCVLASDGSVYAFSLSEHYVPDQEHIRSTQMARSVTVSTIWIARKRHMAAQDVDIADDGSVILCTLAGSVFRSSIRKKKISTKRKSEYKFDRVPLITRTRSVRCDPGFGSFAAICEDVETPPLFIDRTNLSDDMHFLVSYVPHDKNRSERLLGQSQDASQDSKHELKFLGPINASDEDGNADEQTSSVRTGPLMIETDESYAGLRSWLSSYPEDGFKLSTSEVEFMAERGFDLALRVGDRAVPVHRAVVESRCPKLMNVLGSKVTLNVGKTGTRHIRPGKHGQVPCIEFEGFQLTTLLVFAYYLYTDYSLKPWSERTKSTMSQDSSIEMGLLKEALHLVNYWPGIYREEEPRRNLGHDLMTLTTPAGAATADVVIFLEGGASTLAHSYILSLRSAYFATLLSERWSDSRTYDSHGNMSVFLEHIPADVFGIVVRHLYGDFEESIFNDVAEETSKDFVRFVLNVMEVADELLLPKLQQICECVIRNFVTVKNVAWLLSESIKYAGSQLVENLLYYIRQNLECLLENGFLIDMKPDAMTRVESFLRRYLKTSGMISTRSDPTEAFYRFLDNADVHNDFTAAVVPICGASSQFSFLSQKIPRVQKLAELADISVSSAADEDIFQFDQDGATPKKEGSPPVSERQRTKSVESLPGGPRHPANPWTVVSRGSPKLGSSGWGDEAERSPALRRPSTGVRPIAALSSTPPVGMFGSPASVSGSKAVPLRPRNLSSTSPGSVSPRFDISRSARSSVHRLNSIGGTISSSPINASPSVPGLGAKQAVASTPSINQSKLSPLQWATPSPKASTSIGSSGAAQRAGFVPTINDVSAKLSQKERKRLEREQKQKHKETPSMMSEAVRDPPTPVAPNSPWSKPVDTDKPRVSNDSPFAAYKAKGKAPSKPEAPLMSLGDIIQQEQRAIQAESERNSRSLKDIQQEEEFEKWWAQESQRVQGPSEDNAKEPEKPKGSNPGGPKGSARQSKPRRGPRLSVNT